jgi:hypothetical protein
VEQLLEEGERVTVAEDDAGDRRAVGSLVGAEYLRAEPRDQRGSDGIVGREEMVDDLVARDCRGTVPAECLQRGRLARPDATGDRYRDRSGNVRAGQGLALLCGLFVRDGVILDDGRLDRLRNLGRLCHNGFGLHGR